MATPLRKINPYALGAAFLQFAERKEWLKNEGTKTRPYYFLTDKGEKELTRKPYQIDLKDILAKQ